MLVPESSNDARLNRRALLLGAVFLVGGTAALTRFSRDPQDTAESGPVFTPDQFALLEQVTEVMIPATDTPGALGAGVPAFLRQMLSAWGSNETRVAVVRVLEAIEKESWGKLGAGFLEIPGERRLELMRSYDEKSIAMHDLAYGRACLPLAEVGRASAV